MAKRTRTPAPSTALSDDIRDHGYAILQTRIERVPGHHRNDQCTELDGERRCTRPATLVTFAIDELTSEGENTTGVHYARNRDDAIVRIPSCDEHRCEASHDLFFVLTGRERPDGIRAFDFPGQHLNWL